jgi:hypothetical protein
MRMSVSAGYDTGRRFTTIISNNGQSNAPLLLSSTRLFSLAICPPIQRGFTLGYLRFLMLIQIEDSLMNNDMMVSDGT